MKVLARGREAGVAERAFQPARLLASGGALRWLGPELRARAHLLVGNVRRVSLRRSRGQREHRRRERGEAPDPEEVHARPNEPDGRAIPGSPPGGTRAAPYPAECVAVCA